MACERLRDKQEIEEHLRRDVHLHLYALGDLDAFFWPYTAWYGLRSGDDLRAVALVYTGQPLPVLLALDRDPEAMGELLNSIRDYLPDRFYSHLSPGLESVFTRTHRADLHGEHYKMALRDRAKPESADYSGTIPLGAKDLDELQEFYAESYPGNWFDPRMLETGQYYGIRERGRLVSAGGVHVYSPRYGVAALGNIATHPGQRGRGHGTAVTARICQSVGVESIGLNVKTDNESAIASYTRLGFEIASIYGEFLFDAG
jgi:GNAT superfamily N-acetyltransferase